TQTAVRERERRIEIRRALEMFDSFVDVFARDGVINKAGQTVAAAQIFFVGFGVGGLAALEAVLFIRTQLQPQAVADFLSDRILDVDDVSRIGIDAVTPQQ